MDVLFSAFYGGLYFMTNLRSHRRSVLGQPVEAQSPKS